MLDYMISQNMIENFTQLGAQSAVFERVDDKWVLRREDWINSLSFNNAAWLIDRGRLAFAVKRYEFNVDDVVEYLREDGRLPYGKLGYVQAVKPCKDGTVRYECRFGGGFDVVLVSGKYIRHPILTEEG